MLTISATFDGVQLNDLEKWTFSGSSSPQTFLLPRCVGALLRPSKDVTRQITLVSQRFPPGSPLKTAIETLQHDLNECLIEKQTATLVVNGVGYSDATPISVTQNVLSVTDYMTYSIVFELSKDQLPFEPALKDGRVRDAFFFGYEDAPPSCGFPLFDNFEAAINVSYSLNQQQRSIGEYGRLKYPIGGIETISLDCWMVEQTQNNFQKYMADYLFGPMGKIGTLNLNGNIFNFAILINMSCSSTVGSSLTYKLTFQTSLQC